MNMATILIGGLWVYIAIYLTILVRDVYRHRDQLGTQHLKYNAFISAVANFFDTLGIGSFAIATSSWKFKGSMRDDLIPGTLNVAFAIPMCVEAMIFLKKVEVDPLTLVLMIGASMVGAVLGAKIVSRLDISRVRVAMGVALLIVAAVTVCKINGFGPFGLLGTATGLTGIKLGIATVFSFVFGSLMSIGIGFYAPCMALVLMLGMNADVAFPIMMGASGYMCLSNGITFIRAGKYERTSTLPMVLAGSAAVLIAAFIVTSLPLLMLTYLVCGVMVFCAVTFFRDARGVKHGKDKAPAARKRVAAKMALPKAG